MPLRFLLLIILLVACAPETGSTATPTRSLSAPTLAPSPTVDIRNSDELYGPDGSDGQNDPTAAALPSGGGLPPLAIGTQAPGGAQRVTITLTDGRLLVAELYEPALDLSASAGLRVPGVLLVGSNSAEWRDVGPVLRASGYSALVIGLDSAPSTADAVPLLDALSELGSVDPARIVVVGSPAAQLALDFCGVYAACDGTTLADPLNPDALLQWLAAQWGG